MQVKKTTEWIQVNENFKGDWHLELPKSASDKLGYQYGVLYATLSCFSTHITCNQYSCTHPYITSFIEY